MGKNGCPAGLQNYFDNLPKNMPDRHPLHKGQGGQHGAEGGRQSDVPSLRQMMVEKDRNVLKEYLESKEK